MLDPLRDVRIVHQRLTITFITMLSVGGWSVTTTTFKFRYEGTKQRFHLIGEEYTEMQRNTGQKVHISNNFIIKKQKIITGLNEFAQKTGMAKTA